MTTAVMRYLRPRAIALLTVALCMGASPADTDPAANTPAAAAAARLKTALLLQTLNADLLSHDSATSTLERWCTTYRLASPPRMTAERVPAVVKAPTAEQRRQLAVAAGDALAPLLPEGWETMSPDRIGEAGEACLPEQLLEHRALLTLPDGTPFSEVVETYTSNVLAIPGRRLARCPH